MERQYSGDRDGGLHAEVGAGEKTCQAHSSPPPPPLPVYISHRVLGPPHALPHPQPGVHNTLPPRPAASRPAATHFPECTSSLISRL